MKVLIIGGTAFMGPLVTRKLADSGHDITLFHRGNTNTKLPEGVREIFGDRNRLADYADELKKIQPDVVLDMMLLIEKNARELVNIMSGSTGRIVAISSCDVYKNYGLLRGTETGPALTNRINENSPLRENLYPYRDAVPDENHPLFNYDKILVERIILSKSITPGTILRLPVVYGPNDKQHRFYEYIKRMEDNRPAVFLGNHQAKFKITRGYCENCAEAIFKAILNDSAAGRIYNVGEPDAPTEHEWIERISRILEWQGKIVVLQEDKLPDHLKTDLHWENHLIIDTTRIREELGYTEIVSREEALNRTVEWERANPPEHVDIESKYPDEDKALE
jgi:nucleoside-diphosphate-sugar epimerase